MNGSVAGNVPSGRVVTRGVIRRIPGLSFLAECIYRSPGSWLFRGERLAWLRDKTLASQLPPSYRFFARYCRLFGDRPPGAELLLRSLIRFRRWRRADSTLEMKVAGMTVCLDLGDPRFLAIPGEVASGLPRFLGEFLRPGDSFVDIGANHGSFSIVAAKLVGPHGRVVAVEPQERLAEAVRQSLTHSPAPFAVHCAACSDREGTAEFFVPDASSGAASLYRSEAGGLVQRTATVRVARLDDMLRETTFPGRVFVKMDIEGNEARCLLGAREFLARYRPLILTEVNPPSLAAAGSSVEELAGVLGELGYTRYRGGEALDVEFAMNSEIHGSNILAIHCLAEDRAPEAASAGQNG